MRSEVGNQHPPCRRWNAPAPLLALLAIALTVLLLAGCGGSSGTPASSGAQHTTAAAGGTGSDSDGASTGASGRGSTGKGSDAKKGGTGTAVAVGKPHLKNVHIQLHLNHLKLNTHLKSNDKLHLSEKLKLKLGKLHLKVKLGNLHLPTTTVGTP